MEKAAWAIMEPRLREQLIRKYVPPERSDASLARQDPLVYKATAFYWLGQELVGNWKAGKRLTIDQKEKLLELLVWNLSNLHQDQAYRDEYESEILMPCRETFTEDEIRSCSFQNTRETIPHAVDIHDVALCETSDEEEYDTSISCETTEQIAQLMIACKEFQLKVADDFSKSQACEVVRLI